MRIWDISRTLSDDLAEWPGDEPFRFRLTKEIAEGQTVNLCAISMSVHNGTHADGKFHFDTDGESIEKAPLEIYLGRATIIDLAQSFLHLKEKHLIAIEDLLPSAEEIAATSRLLVKTGRWSDSKVFPNQLPVIAADVPGWLQKNGVKLLGLELQSADEIDAKSLHNHQALPHPGISLDKSLDPTDL